MAFPDSLLLHLVNADNCWAPDTGERLVAALTVRVPMHEELGFLLVGLGGLDWLRAELLAHVADVFLHDVELLAVLLIPDIVLLALTLLAARVVWRVGLD